jgi:hypothetical protein
MKYSALVYLPVEKLVGQIGNPAAPVFDVDPGDDEYFSEG